MKLQRMLLFAALIAVVASVVSMAAPTRAQDDPGMGLPKDVRVLLHDVRGETAPLRDLDTATEMGYGKFLDCFQNGADLGMGQHYVNGDLAGDDVLDPMQPEALVYEPQADGSQILVAFEYLVFASAWDPNNTGRPAPTLFGQEFHLKTTIPDTPPVWALHVWLWADNPDGLFNDWNPLVFCPTDLPVVDMSAS